MVLVDYIGIFFTCCNTFGIILYMYMYMTSEDMTHRTAVRTRKKIISLYKC